MNYLCFDIGYSMVKAGGLIFPSVVGNSRNIRYSTGFGSEDQISNMHVKIGQEEYFVGKLAQKQSDQVYYSLDEDRYESDEANVLLQTVIALMAGGEQQVGVVTGLPLDYLKYREKLEKSLVGTHTIEINGKQKTTHVANAIVIPQPMGVFFNNLMNDSGNIVNTSYAKKTIGIVDVGFGSTDIAYVKNMEFIDKYSRSTNIAMNSVYKAIAEAIFQEFDVYKELYELEEEVQGGVVRIKGVEYDITNLIEAAKKGIANKLVTWIGTIWKNRPEIDEIIIAGGGGLSLFSHMGGPLDARLSDNPQLAILKGYQKMAKRITVAA